MSDFNAVNLEVELILRPTIILLRSFIAGILLMTGFAKALDLVGFAQVIGTYEVFPDVFLLPIAVSMVLVEVILGACLLLGRNLVRDAAIATALHGLFMLWAILALLRGLDIANCGCFGVFLVRPLTWGTVIEDAVMVAACSTLYGLIRLRESKVL